MARRSYQQYCGLAAALDVVGERWALLIVRDLVPGPRRFSDLFEGLPGIATDMLAERLRSLAAAGAVEQRSLRHPVPAKVYALTERGRELARIAGELAGWGMPLLPPVPTDDDHTNPRWALQAMARTYKGGLADGHYRWTLDDEELTVVVAGGARRPSARLVYGHSIDGTPLLHVRCDERAFFRAARRGGAGAGFYLVAGDTSVVAAFFAAMPLPTVGSTSRRPASVT